MRGRSKLTLFRDKHKHFLISILADNMYSFKDFKEEYHGFVQFNFHLYGIPHFTNVSINHDLTLVLRIERYHKVIHLVKELDNVDALIDDLKEWMQSQILN
jgi:hypothetical protein